MITKCQPLMKKLGTDSKSNNEEVENKDFNKSRYKRMNWYQTLVTQSKNPSAHCL